MSKSRKKQRARERALEAETTPQPAVELEAVEELPPPEPTPLNEALYDLAIRAATQAGQMREEGERLAWVFNGDAIALKYTEPGEAEDQPARLLIAAFRQGVVFQVEGERQVVYQPGPWEAELTRLTTLEPPEDDEDDEAGEAEEDAV
jgi:hypothetical protein